MMEAMTFFWGLVNGVVLGIAFTLYFNHKD